MMDNNIHRKQQSECIGPINEDGNSKKSKDVIQWDSGQNEIKIENQVVDNMENEQEGTAIDGDLDPRIQVSTHDKRKTISGVVMGTEISNAC